MHVAAIIQARLGSSRLPGKILMDIGGKPMLAHVVERVRACELVDTVIVVCPHSDLTAIASYVPGVQVMGGHATDVLDRYYGAATYFMADVVLRVTGDCPLFAPEAGEAVLKAVLLGGRDYANNDTLRSGWSDGCDSEAFTFDMLQQAHEHASDPSDREHVTLWMRRWLGGGGDLTDPCVSWRAPSSSHVKLSVDTAEDLAFVRAVYAALDDPIDYSFDATWRAVEKVLDNADAV